MCAGGKWMSDDLLKRAGSPADILDQARDIRLLLGDFHSAALLLAVALVELDQRIGAVALQQVY